VRGEAALAYLATAQWPAQIGPPEPPGAPVHPYQLARGGLALPWPSGSGAGAAGAMVVARLLRDSYGLARLQWRAPNPDRVPPPALRPAPSGGAKYPCDLYLETGGTGGGPEGLGAGDISTAATSSSRATARSCSPQRWAAAAARRPSATGSPLSPGA
jgi:hypothetical protein